MVFSISTLKQTRVAIFVLNLTSDFSFLWPTIMYYCYSIIILTSLNFNLNYLKLIAFWRPSLFFIDEIKIWKNTFDWSIRCCTSLQASFDYFSYFLIIAPTILLATAFKTKCFSFQQKLWQKFVNHFNKPCKCSFILLAINNKNVILCASAMQSLNRFSINCLYGSNVSCFLHSSFNARDCSKQSEVVAVSHWSWLASVKLSSLLVS